MPDEIQVEIRDCVATITLNRPEKLNAVTPAMTRALLTSVERCNDDGDVRCVVVTGAGQRAFCVGSDIGSLDAYESAWSFRNRLDYCDALRALKKPCIAAVNGYAFGGGLEAAMACDIRLAADSAQFAAPEIKLGWIGGGGMVASLAHAIGPSNAALMILTGDPVSAAQALQWGLVSSVLPSAKLAPEAFRVAALIASRAPIAGQAAKRNLRAAFSLPFQDAIEYERELQAVCLATEDAAEGRAAFKEKRPPRFRGR
jgi:enoyl-CoA hydratase